MSSGGMERSKAKERFSGFFTPFWRQRLQEHRRGLGVGFRQVGKVLGVSGETVRKWESGHIRRCHIAHKGRVWNFLRSHYDRQLRFLTFSRSPLYRQLRQLPLSLRKCFAQAWMVYLVAMDDPREERWFLKKMERCLERTEEKLAREGFPVQKHLRPQVYR